MFVFIERLFKSIFLHAPRETFTIGLMGFDITKIKAYKNADIIHIHWLGQGFINLGSLVYSNIVVFKSNSFSGIEIVSSDILLINSLTLFS